MKNALIILAIVGLLSASLALTACNSEKPPKDTDATTSSGGNTTDNTTSGSDTNSPDNTTVDTGESFPFILDGKPTYRVVRPMSSSVNDPDVKVAVSLRNLLDSITGLTFGISEDWDKPSGDVNEILIGLTTREASVSAYENLAYDAYSVSVVNGDIVIAGWTENSLNRAVDKLIETIKAGLQENASFCIDSELAFDGRDSSMPKIPLPTLEGATLTEILSCRGSMSHIFNFKKAEPGAFSAYTAMLLAEGGKTVQLTSTADGDYTVISNGEYRYTISNWKNTGEISMVIEKNDNEFALTPEEFTAVTEPKVISPGYEFAGVKKGMCYIMQASDGSYVIIDGSESDAPFIRRIYDLLVKYKPAGVDKPHIRAWFLTHQHSDHMNGIIDFAKTYGSLVNCDAVFTNMVPKKYQTAYDNYDDRYNRMVSAASDFGADFVVFRTGQTYYFADIEVFMLETADDMLPTVFSNMDDTSPIMSCNVAGTVCLFSGDAGYSVFNNPVKRYTAATLDSVFCQASSHGQNGSAPVAYYKAASPTYYLWPATKSFYDGKTPEAYIVSDKNATIDYAFNGTKVYTLGKDGITVTAVE